MARGTTGIAIGAVVSVAITLFLRRKARWPASALAAGIGAMVACFFAIAAAEVLPPGSIEWMWKGGLYGAMFGVPVAVILSPIGLLSIRPPAQS